MKKNWNNPVVKTLKVEYTHEGEYDGWVIGDDGSRVNANTIDTSVEPQCLGRYGYECSCCHEQSGYIYVTNVGAKLGLIAHWVEAHPKGCKVS